MRSITWLSLGVLATVCTCFALHSAPSVVGDDGYPYGPPAPYPTPTPAPYPAPTPTPYPTPTPAPYPAPTPTPYPAPAPAPVPAAPYATPPGYVAPAPAKEPTVTSKFLLALVGDWGCDCAYPTGGHATGGAAAKLILGGTAVQTEHTLDWTTGEGKDAKTERIYNMAIWKVAADGKTVSYWGYSSHDTDVDMLSGTLTDTSATVSGTTRWGPMKVVLSLKDGVLSEQRFIDKGDMGVVSYKKK